MGNHFHLVIETPEANLVAGMKWLLSAYTIRFNRRHKEFGHLFSGRYKSLVVDGSTKGYLKTVCDYVHLNPGRAKLLGADQPLQELVWSSYPLYLAKPSRRPAWLRVERLFGEWGIPKDSEAGRRRFGQCMERRRQEDLGEEFARVDRGWFLGDDEFKQELLEQVTAKPGVRHYGEVVQEASETRAEILVREGLKQLKWTEKHLADRRKGDPGKVRLAFELRSKTAMPLAWIADRLKMGSRGYLTFLLYRHNKIANE